MLIKHIILLFYLLCLLSCKEKTPKSKYNCPQSNWVESPVQATTIGFKNNSILYKLMNIASTRDTISIAGYQNELIYYKNNNDKVFVEYVFISREKGGKNAQHYISTGSVLTLSHSENIKQFYIQWPNGKIDSLYVDYLKDLTRDNSCCCQYPLQSLTLNSKKYFEKKEFDNYGIYIFEK